MAKKKKQEFISNQGQRGTELELGYDDLNQKEQKLLASLNAEGTGKRPAMGLWDMVEATGWKSVGKTKGNSWVRNSLRRLVRARLVEHAEDVGDGIYQISKVGRRSTNKTLGIAQTKRKPKAPAKKKEPAVAAKPKAAAKPKRTKRAPVKEPAAEPVEAKHEEAPAEPLFSETEQQVSA